MKLTDKLNQTTKSTAIESIRSTTGLILMRDYLDDVTKGRLIGYINGEVVLDINTIELKWLDNQNEISCIPEGLYDCVPDIWNKYNRKVLGIKNVPGRDRILFHSANYAGGKKVQLKGCIAPVTSYADLDKDGIIDGTNSKNAFNKLMKKFGKIETQILIMS